MPRLRAAVSRKMLYSREKQYLCWVSMRVLFSGDPSLVSDAELEAAMAEIPAWRRAKALAIKPRLARVLCVEAFRLLMRALSEDYGIAYIPEFAYGEHGKPWLREYPHVHFNLSHCRSAAMCVVSGEGPVGCDIEAAGRRFSDALLDTRFSPEEAARVRAAADQRREFATLWTKKEAVCKFTGRGIDESMPELLTPGRLAGLSLTDGYNAAAGYVYAICSEEKYK